jgi:hypothetical protein
LRRIIQRMGAEAKASPNRTYKSAKIICSVN